MRTILITGATGFVGSNLTRHFLAKGWRVHLLVRANSNTARIRDCIGNVSVHTANLTDRDALFAAVKRASADVIIHTAVYGGVAGQTDRDTVLQTNLLGTINLLDACREHGFRLFINTGSSSEYGRKERAMREDDVLEPNTDYGVFKAAATLYCQHVAREQHLPITTLRLFSPYGYADESGRLIPTLIRALLEGKPPQLSSPDHVRDFIFIEDVLAAYEAVIDHPESVTGEIFNVCTGVERSVRDVDQAIRSIIASPEPVWGAHPRMPEPSCWVGENAKIAKAIGWQPTHTLDDGLRKTIEWYRRQGI